MNDYQISQSFLDIKNLKEDNLLVETNENNDPEPVGKLLNRVFLKGLQKEVSEIIFDPQSDSLKILFCQYGVCQELIKPLKKAVSKALISKLKGIANIKQDDYSQAHIEGSFSKKIQDCQFNFWLNLTPTKHGKKISLSWWNNAQCQFSLEELIGEQNTHNLVEEIANNSSGLLLVTGLNNSGKSTTLYSILSSKNKQGISVSSIEKRLKYVLSDVKQIEINNQNNFDYEKAINTLIEENYQVILIDDLTEDKNASLACKAVEKGHLILSTLNVNNLYFAIKKLLEIGLTYSDIAKSLNGIINQRLLRKLCPHCRIEYNPSQIELNRFGIFQQKENNFYYANNLEENDCPHCQGVGYKGQIAVYEILNINEKVSTIIAESQDLPTIKQIIKRENSQSILNYALNFVMSGKTTFLEIERVLSDYLNNEEEEEEIIVPKFKMEPDSEQKNSDFNSENKKDLNIVIQENDSVLVSFLKDFEQKIIDQYNKKLEEFQEEIEKKYSEKFNLIQEHITNKYEYKIIKLEDKIDILIEKNKTLEGQLNKFISDYSEDLLTKKSTKTHSIEELKDDADWNDLTKELEETFDLNPIQNKENDIEENPPKIEYIEEKEINIEDNNFDQDSLDLKSSDHSYTEQLSEIEDSNELKENKQNLNKIEDPW